MNISTISQPSLELVPRGCVLAQNSNGAYEPRSEVRKPIAPPADLGICSEASLWQATNKSFHWSR